MAPLDIFNGTLPEEKDYGSGEESWYQRNEDFFAAESGYSAIQSTKPQTLAFALNDSPAGLCAWILEKRRTWSDCSGDVERRFSKDDLLTTMSIYWFTQSYGTSARYYYECVHTPMAAGPRSNTCRRGADWYRGVPGRSYFVSQTLGATVLQPKALAGDAFRWSFRADGRTTTPGGRHAFVLSFIALTLERSVIDIADRKPCRDH